MDAPNACPGEKRCGERRLLVCRAVLVTALATASSHAVALAPTGGEQPAPATSGLAVPGEADARTGVAARERAIPLGGLAGDSNRTGSQPAGNTAEASGASSPLGGLVDLALPMAVVLGAIFGAAWLFRRVMGAGSSLASSLGAGGRAPSGVLEILGRYPVARGQMLVLLKLDRRILLLGHSAHGRAGSTGGGFATLSEISDPEEVASILMRVEEGTGESFASRYEQLLKGEGDATDRDGVVDFATLQTTGRKARRSRDGDAVELWDATRSTPGRAQVPEQARPEHVLGAVDGEASLRERLLKLRAGSAGTRAG